MTGICVIAFSYLSVRKMMQGDEGDGLSQRPTSPSPSQSSHAPSSSTWSKFCHKSKWRCVHCKPLMNLCITEGFVIVPDHPMKFSRNKLCLPTEKIFLLYELVQCYNFYRLRYILSNNAKSFYSWWICQLTLVYRISVIHFPQELLVIVMHPVLWEHPSESHHSIQLQIK